jgi:hypothetical protein
MMRDFFEAYARAADSGDLQVGARVYLDTAMAGSGIFARSVRILTQSANGQSNGQLQSYDPASGELVLRDVLAPEPANFRLAPDATVLRDGKPASPELRPAPWSSEVQPSVKGPGMVREISILPGRRAFVFAGRVSHLDLHIGLLVLADPRDLKSCDIHFDPAMGGIEDRLYEGGDVTVTTTFDGTNYTASSIVINAAPAK